MAGGREGRSGRWGGLGAGPEGPQALGRLWLPLCSTGGFKGAVWGSEGMRLTRQKRPWAAGACSVGTAAAQARRDDG